MNVWKVSAGTASLIGGKNIKTDALPTTAYIMLGKKCRNNCRFCTQSQSSKAGQHMLSRITWPEMPDSVAAAGVAAAYENGRLRRACFQVVNNKEAWDNTLAALNKIRQTSAVPVCVSSPIESFSQAEILLAGAERICIALDAATPDIYQAVKGGDWQKKWDLLINCAKAFPNRISTHLIVGLGETEEEMINMLSTCIENGVTVGLFAFTPVRGTAWENRQAVDIGRYRRIQIAHHLLRRGYGRQVIHTSAGQITSFGVENILEELRNGAAFQTSGCPDCNRPYYNERPGGIMYNYPRPLTPEELSEALRESGVFREEHHEVAGA